MNDLLERTHLEPLVVRRLPSVTDRPAEPRPRWTRRRAAGAIGLAAVIVGIFMSV